MPRTVPPGERRPSRPHRTAVKVLAFAYAISLAGTASLLLTRVGRFDWKQRWRAWTRPPLHYPAGYVRPRLPAHLPPLPPAPVAARTARGFVWHTPPTRVFRHRAAETAPRELRRAPARAVRLARRVDGIGARPAPARAPRASHEFRIVDTPTGNSYPTWAHPPDPTLPAECRPRAPVVVPQE